MRKIFIIICFVMSYQVTAGIASKVAAVTQTPPPEPPPVGTCNVEPEQYNSVLQIRAISIVPPSNPLIERVPLHWDVCVDDTCYTAQPNTGRLQRSVSDSVEVLSNANYGGAQWYTPEGFSIAITASEAAYLKDYMAGKVSGVVHTGLTNQSTKQLAQYLVGGACYFFSFGQFDRMREELLKSREKCSVCVDYNWSAEYEGSHHNAYGHHSGPYPAYDDTKALNHGATIPNVTYMSHGLVPPTGTLTLPYRNWLSLPSPIEDTSTYYWRYTAFSGYGLPFDCGTFPKPCHDGYDPNVDDNIGLWQGQVKRDGIKNPVDIEFSATTNGIVCSVNYPADGTSAKSCRDVTVDKVYFCGYVPPGE